jgi:hypothetical protein
MLCVCLLCDLQSSVARPPSSNHTRPPSFAPATFVRYTTPHASRRALKPAHASDAHLVPYARDLARSECALGRAQELLKRELRVRGGEGGPGLRVSIDVEARKKNWKGER